jgi:tRNA pseudouridine55 synthase
MLPICFGEATKFGAQLLDADKTYRVTARLGERTASADRESEVIETRELPPFTADQLERALAEFPREYSQVPPMHSAIKQEGRPLYEYARAGITRERAARDIVIHDMRLLGWQPPDLSFDVRCTKGAYIRVLAEDIAARLGTIAHLVGLRRLAVAPFLAEPQWTFDALDALTAAQRLECLLPVDAALTGWRRLDLPEGGVVAFRQGQTVSIPAQVPGNVRIYAAGVGFLGLGAIEPAGRLVPLRLISAIANRA